MGKPTAAVVSLLWGSLRRIKYLDFALTVAAGAPVLWHLLRSRGAEGGRFHDEAAFLIVLSTAVAFGEICVRPVQIYRGLHALRLALLLAVLEILQGRQVVMALLLLCPFLLGAAVYDTVGAAALLNGLSLVAVNVQHVRFGWGSADAPDWGAAAALNVICLAFAWLAALAGFLRQRTVDSERQIGVLENTVESLTRANIGFQDYAELVESETAERERQRVTRELHDSIGYTLTNVSVMMNAGRILLEKDPPRLLRMFDEVRTMVDSALLETRRILHVLREIREPRRTGLKALWDLIKGFRAVTGIRVELSSGNLPWSLGQHLDYVVLRLVQEGITNAFRHGKADHVRILLWRADEGVRVSVWDNGRGAGADIEEGIGLKGMRERLGEVGGTLSAHNVADGFELAAFIPLRREVISGSD